MYSQAAGLTHFLIYYDNARYRDALVSYLSVVYAGRDNHDTLARLTGASYGELDKQYREFLEGKRNREAVTSGPSPPPQSRSRAPTALPSDRGTLALHCGLSIIGQRVCHGWRLTGRPVHTTTMVVGSQSNSLSTVGIEGEAMTRPVTVFLFVGW